MLNQLSAWKFVGQVACTDGTAGTLKCWLQLSQLLQLLEVHLSGWNIACQACLRDCQYGPLSAKKMPSSSSAASSPAAVPKQGKLCICHAIGTQVCIQMASHPLLSSENGLHLEPSRELSADSTLSASMLTALSYLRYPARCQMHPSGRYTHGTGKPGT